MREQDFNEYEDYVDWLVRKLEDFFPSDADITSAGTAGNFYVTPFRDEVFYDLIGDSATDYDWDFFYNYYWDWAFDWDWATFFEDFDISDVVFDDEW